MPVKTTLNLDERLLVRAKALALREGTTLTAIVEQSLRARLAPRPKRPNSGKAEEFELPTVTGTAAPNVDVADREALLDVLSSNDDER